ncbi:MAG: phenylalanine--tRNA ligase subunit beta, partial [Chloroflexota bacterium]
IALTGSSVPPAPDRHARPFDIDDAKGLIELLCRRLGAPTPAYSAITDDPNLHPGRAARVAGNGVVGRLGEIHPDLAESLDLRAARVVVGEFAIAGLAGGQPEPYRVAAPSRQPTVERDLAVIVPEDRGAAEVASTIRSHAGPLLRDLTLFDVYRGKPLGEGEKSLAYRLALRDEDRTLTEAELDAVVEAVKTGLAADLGARIRS